MNPALRTTARRTRGNSLAPVLMIVAALGVSAAIFFFYTRKQIEKAKEDQIVTETSAHVTAVSPDQSAPKNDVVSQGNKPAPQPPPVVAPPTKPVEVGGQFLKQIISGDLAAASKMLAPDETKAAEVRGILEKVTRDLGYKPGDAAQVEVLGQVENMIRVAVPFTSPVPGAPPARIILDLQRDGKGGWMIAQMHLPKEMEPALAGMPAAKATSPGTAPGGTASQPKPLVVVDREPDAMMFASEFVHALLKPDYGRARVLVDQEKVPPVKLAALCIVFEEGGYKLSPDKPLLSTVATDTTSWVIVRVNSESLKQETEFGLEMEKTAGTWRIGGLNLSKLLSDNAKDSTIAGVPYTPLLQNPKGGESIALYYEFDRAELHPRAQKQLDIVVQMLRNSPQKKLRISGFTDAQGTDAYNLNLSRARAEAVKGYILSKGVPLAQVETTGFGKALPISPNVKADGTDNPDGRSRNRRAEILLDF